MNLPPTDLLPPAPRRPLRLWPGLLLAVLLLVIKFGGPWLFPDALAVTFLGALACGALILGWWLFFSRAPWPERIGIVLVMAAALFATSQIVHPSIAGGMMRMMLPIVAIPILALGLVIAAAASRRWSTGARRGALVVAILLVCGTFTLLRTGGITADARSDFHWRWTKTPEEQLLAASDAPALSSVEKPKMTPPIQAAAKHEIRWPGFRGPARDGVVRGATIATDWQTSPPVELWRRPLGPGWSSFAVSGGLFYTQEQRGEDEIVACYNLATGDPVWRHQNAARFYESNAGPGPRGTPTLHEGRVYAFGATGLVNALDALTGAAIWTRDAAADTRKKAPDWGFASSPLVVGDHVIVAATGTLIAYDRATGEPRWTGPADGGSYSSPHLLEIEGVPQVMLMSKAGATSVTPADGKILWQHAWPGYAIVQPAQIAGGDLLISTGDRLGARRIQVAHTNAAWTITERWTTNRLKAYFNDFVIHQGHAYGFDGGILTCVDLIDGRSKWKGGRYGSGQLILLADQEVLIVLAEQGALALVAAKPDAFTELANLKALEGKTWNHPVLAGDVLLVRNDREMVALRLALKDGEKVPAPK